MRAWPIISARTRTAALEHCSIIRSVRARTNHEYYMNFEHSSAHRYYDHEPNTMALAMVEAQGNTTWKCKLCGKAGLSLDQYASATIEYRSTPASCLLPPACI